MKFIITESQKMKIFMDIYNFIEDRYDLDDITIQDPSFSAQEGVIQVWTGDYDYLFTIYLPEYWNQESEGGLGAFKRSPILALNSEDYDKYNSLFGNRWIEPMKKFIEHNFEIKVKSIE